MTMEISEIGIRMRVRDGGGGSGVAQAKCGPDDGDAEGADGGREEIVQACVRRVLHALKALQER